MDNNILQMLIKMLSPGGQQVNQQNTTSYPMDFSQNQVETSQNGLLPFLLSVLSKKDESASKQDNKKAELVSASNDEIFL